MDAIRERRSVHAYTEQIPDEGLIRELLDAAAVAAIIVGYASGSVPAVSRKPPHILAWVKP